MHTRASNSELVEPLAETERTLNRRLRRQNRRVMFERRNKRPEHPRVIYPTVLAINHFRHFLILLENFNPMDDEPMWTADRVVTPTLGPAITIPETANEFAIKENHLTLVKGNQFDGRIKTDPHTHVHEFLDVKKKIGWMNSMKELLNPGMKFVPLGLNEITQEALNTAAGDKGSSNSDTDKIMARIDAITMKMDAQYKEIQSRAKCNHRGGNHSTAECNDDDTPKSREKEAKFMQTF
ncbi:hypothetical protein Tco_0860741 [Tanacetum coccineum]|uniref:Reverse transcriptase domain-containing protein n=1 Tax=Tanacetum coccineum TaxID=301880 RepID=A0ABQ5BHJ1_9ASTR